MSESRVTKLGQWGNSAAVRISTATLESAHLKVDDAVEIVATDGEIVIRRLIPEVTLNDLLDRFDPSIHRHELMLDFPPVGTETGAAK
jgi:antitoxin component of MazEF toxin-antitoxin module